MHGAKPWRLGQLFAQRHEKGRTGLPVKAVTRHQGLVDRDSLGRKMTSALSDEEHLLVRQGDIAYNMMRMWQGSLGLAQADCVVSPAYVVLVPGKDVDARFAVHLFRTKRVLHLFASYANGIVDDRLRLYYKDFAKIRLTFPSVEQQRSIAGLLDNWDSANSLTEQLLTAKLHLRKGLAQQLLSGRLRFPQFHTEWSRLLFCEATKPLADRNNSKLAIDRVRTVDNRQGLISSDERMRGATLDRYKRVPPKAFAYNPMRLNIGSIAMSDENEDVLVSPDYVVFKCRDGKLDPDYFNHLRRTHEWKCFVNIAGNGSVRVRIYYKDLAAMPLRLPRIEEQRRIAGVLNACDQEIHLLKAQLEMLKLQKKALLQNLLTGKIRVKEAAA